MTPIDAHTHQQIVAQARACGIGSDAIAMELGPGGDLYVTIKAKALTDAQINCVSTAERNQPYPIIMFSDQEVSRRSYELEHRQERAAAREWLRSRGLLSSLPSYDPKSESVSTFARRLEAYCQIEPGSVLDFHELGMLSFSKKWIAEGVNRPPDKARTEKFDCLLRAIAASSLEEHGIRFGFVGNEYVSGQKRP